MLMRNPLMIPDKIKIIKNKAKLKFNDVPITGAVFQGA